MIWVFDKQMVTVPEQGHPFSGYYYEKMQYMPNIVNGVTDEGIVGHGGLFIDMFQCGTPYETIQTDDITDETDLLYLIEPWPMFNGLIEKEGLKDIRSPVNWNVTLKYIPESILQLARDKRLTILLHIAEFTHGMNIVKENMKTTIEYLKIPAEQFKYIGGSRDDGTYYWPGFEYSQLACYLGADVVKKVRLTRRPKKFTCLNLIDKTHRRYVAMHLWSAGLANKGFLSYAFKHFTWEGMSDSNWHYEPWDSGVEWDIPLWQLKKFYDAGPWKADDLSFSEHNHHWHIESQHYTDAYWNFVTETGITSYTFLSEKTFKPIANLQPFIIMGSRHSLKLLQNLGYKTFGEFIDESYDDIPNPDLRIKAATRQAIALAKMSHAKHIKLMKQIKPILEHNQRHFFSSKNRIENFVKYIYGNDPAYDWLKDCKYD